MFCSTAAAAHSLTRLLNMSISSVQSYCFSKFTRLGLLYPRPTPHPRCALLLNERVFVRGVFCMRREPKLETPLKWVKLQVGYLSAETLANAPTDQTVLSSLHFLVVFICLPTESDLSTEPPKTFFSYSHNTLFNFICFFFSRFLLPTKAPY